MRENMVFSVQTELTMKRVSKSGREMIFLFKASSD